MKTKITAQLVAALQPAERPYDVNDTDLRGFQLRVHPSGTKTYLCNGAPAWRERRRLAQS